MSTVGVFASYLDFEHRLIAATADNDVEALSQCVRMCANHKAKILSGPFRVLKSDDGSTEYLPLE